MKPVQPCVVLTSPLLKNKISTVDHKVSLRAPEERSNLYADRLLRRPRRASRNDASVKILKEIYQRLYNTFGPQHWWPGESPFEVIVGAILTQNTNWGNVEKAIRNLKSHKALTPEALYKVSQTKLALLIRPAGYFNVKAKRLKSFVEFLFKNYSGDLRKMKTQPLDSLRRELLNVKGIGPETADSILLYALEYPSFVIDAYTKRVLYRHNMISKEADYYVVQKLFTDNLERDTKNFNEYHALIVKLAKQHCRPKPDCIACPLNEVRYSLKNKCARCHRAFLPREKRMPDKALQFICVPCYDLANSSTK